MKFNNQNGSALPLLIPIALILTMMVGIGGYYLGKSSASKTSNQNSPKTNVPTQMVREKTASPSSSPDTLQYWVTYSKDYFDFTFKHPPSGFRIEQQENVYASARYCDYSYDFTSNCGVPAPDKFEVGVDILKPGQSLEEWLDFAHEHRSSPILYKDADFIWKDTRNKKEWITFLGYKAYHLDIIFDKELVDKYAPFKITQEELDNNKGDDIWVVYAKNSPLKEDYYIFVKGNKVYTVEKITSSKSKAEIEKIAESFKFIR